MSHLFCHCAIGEPATYFVTPVNYGRKTITNSSKRVNVKKVTVVTIANNMIMQLKGLFCYDRNL